MSHPYKLGRKACPPGFNALHFEDYLLKRSALAAPPTCDYRNRVSGWPMFCNDKWGCCTISALAHLVQLFTANKVIPTDAMILTAYQAITKAEGAEFNPVGDKNDNGCQMVDVQNYFKNVGMAGCKIDAFVKVPVGSVQHLKLALYLFGAVNLGVALPNSLDMNADVWRKMQNTKGDNEPGSLGGHDIIAVAYSHYGLQVVSWGRLITVDWGFWGQCGEESYATLSPDWLGINDQAPNHFNFAQLNADLSLVKAA